MTTIKIHIPEFIANNMPEFVITSGSHPINHPFEYYFFNKGMYLNDNMSYRQYAYKTAEAVAHFVERIDQLDTGCVQLWQLNKNNNTWFEMGSLYL